MKLLILEKESHVIWKKKKKGKMDFSTSFEWIQSKDGIENYIVAKIFDAPSIDKKVWKKRSKSVV